MRSVARVNIGGGHISGKLVAEWGFHFFVFFGEMHHKFLYNDRRVYRITKQFPFLALTWKCATMVNTANGVTYLIQTNILDLNFVITNKIS